MEGDEKDTRRRDNTAATVRYEVIPASGSVRGAFGTRGTVVTGLDAANAAADAALGVRGAHWESMGGSVYALYASEADAASDADAGAYAPKIACDEDYADLDLEEEETLAARVQIRFRSGHVETCWNREDAVKFIASMGMVGEDSSDGRLTRYWMRGDSRASEPTAVSLNWDRL